MKQIVILSYKDGLRFKWNRVH